MSSVDKIKWAMSLRDPQYEALKYFDAISSKMDYRTVSKAEAEKIASENCQDHTKYQWIKNLIFLLFVLI